MPGVSGIHHITAISGDAVETATFYRDVLRQQLVKKTVNFDDPQTYHLYFGSDRGAPGTIMTHFPWGSGAPRGRVGTGQVGTVSYAITSGSSGYWLDRLRSHGIEPSESESPFGEAEIRFTDPFGMQLRLLETTNAAIPADDIVEFAAPELFLTGYERTAALLEGVLGFEVIDSRNESVRLGIVGSPGMPSHYIDLRCLPTARPGLMGAGVVHHVAFRVGDDDAQREIRETLGSFKVDVTPVLDRNYFRSIYFREPGGIVFEIATDPPGFAIDEKAEELGQKLMLPPWLEDSREQIEAKLPVL